MPRTPVVEVMNVYTLTALEVTFRQKVKFTKINYISTDTYWC